MQRGWSRRRIVRDLEVDRETVKRYAPPQKPATNPTAGFSPGPASRCEPRRAVITAGLERGLTAQRIHQDLCTDQTMSALAQDALRRHQEAASSRLPHAEFLELILHDEVNVREQCKIARRTASAEFAALKSLDDFDWRFNPSVSRMEIHELAACHFIRQGTDVLFVGPPGVGKHSSRRPSATLRSGRASSCAIAPSSI